MILDYSNLLLLGDPVLVVVTLDSNNTSLITIDTLNIIDSDGRLIESIDSMSNFTTISEGGYFAVFTPLSESFSLQVMGVDRTGNNFSHFFDTSVEVSSIFWTLGK